MLKVHVGRAIGPCLNYLANQAFHDYNLATTTNVTPLLSPLSFSSQQSISGIEGLRKCFRSKQVNGRSKSASFPLDTVTKRWLVCIVHLFKKFPACLVLMADHYSSAHLQCQSLDPVSSDDEYNSSTKIAVSLFKRYRNAVDRGGTDNLKVTRIFFFSIHCFSLFTLNFYEGMAFPLNFNVCIDGIGVY